MNAKNLSHLIAIISAIICNNLINHSKSYAQPKVGIYAIETGYDTSGRLDSNYFITYYDYLTGAYDTTIHFKGYVNNLDQVTIDPYNGRYFLYGKVDSPKTSQSSSYKIITVDLCNKTIAQADYSFANGLRGEMEYDMFGNRILVRKTDSFFEYDIAAQQVSYLGTISIKNIVRNNVISHSKSAYSTMHDQYTFFVYDTSITQSSRVLTYNVGQNKVIADITCNTMHELTYDQLNDKYYCQVKDSIMLFDPNTGSMRRIATSPAHFIHLNQNRCILDATNGKFIHQQDNRINNISNIQLDIFDVNTGAVITKKYDYDAAEMNEYYGGYPPQIKITEDSMLIATYGSSYQWYLDGKKIDGATSQSYNPAHWGAYSVDVTFCNEIRSSQPIIFTPEYVSDAPETNAVIFPNPVHTTATVQLTNNNYNEVSFTLYNSIGQKVKSYTVKGKPHIIIDRYGLCAGIYYYQLLGDGVPIQKGIIEVE